MFVHFILFKIVTKNPMKPINIPKIIKTANNNPFVWKNWSNLLPIKYPERTNTDKEIPKFETILNVFIKSLLILIQFDRLR